MAIYKTYKEAVLANGSTKGVFTTGRSWDGGERWVGSFYIGDELTEPGIADSAWVECNPADYLETLESFLANGKSLKHGDLVITWNGSVHKVYSESTMNKPDSDDKSRFILQAAADQVEVPEEKEAFDSMPQQAESEWNHSDKCVWNGNEVTFVAPLPSRPSLCVIEPQAPSERMTDIVRISELSKPETPAEREERERVEAAYKLHRIHHIAIGRTLLTYKEFLKAKNTEGWLAVVDETGYRKQ